MGAEMTKGRETGWALSLSLKVACAQCASQCLQCTLDNGRLKKPSS